MKREIKFRVWNGLSMDYSDCLHCFFDIYSDDDSMQYIGINDKNGKEIYEGDIILHKPHWMTNHTKSTVQYIKSGFFYPFGDIVLHEPHWMTNHTKSTVQYVESGFFYPFGNSDFALEGKEVEIIGNIFENPELA